MYELNEGTHDRFNRKAIFMAGGAGSGKSRVAKTLAGMVGMKYVDVDQIYELLSKQHNVDISAFEIDQKKQYVFDKSRELFDKVLISLISIGVGLIIDGTSRDIIARMRLKQLLEDKGYNCALLYVKADVDIARQRNIERERRVDPEFLELSHKQVNQNTEIYKQIFGNAFFTIDNSSKDGYNIKELNNIKNWLVQR